MVHFYGRSFIWSFIWAVVRCFVHYLRRKHPILLVKKNGPTDQWTDGRTDPLIEMRKPHLKMVFFSVNIDIHISAKIHRNLTCNGSVLTA